MDINRAPQQRNGKEKGKKRNSLFHPINKYRDFKQGTKNQLQERKDQLINGDVDTDQGNKQLKVMLKALLGIFILLILLVLLAYL